jgi:hypothetical protein
LLVELARGLRGVVWAAPQQELQADCASHPRALICGAFDPLHAGHQRLRDVAACRLEYEAGYELSIRNVDKPPLDYLTIARRRAQFAKDYLALTSAPTILAKSQALPGTTFVVGLDTAERVIAPRYYGGNSAQMLAALQEIRARGCRFLVAGRIISNRFLTLDDLPIPAGCADLFESIPESEFRVDISSTELRRSTGAADA